MESWNEIRKAATAFSKRWKGKWTFVFTAAILLSGAALASWHVAMSTLPHSPYPDTEVSAVQPINAGRDDARKVDVHIQLFGTSSNDLEVAFGRDANMNGVLDVGETETVYGWRGGRYFIENAVEWERMEVPATNGTWGVMDLHFANGPDFALEGFAATCGGNPCFTQLATEPPPAWLFRREWNLMRVTRRGAGMPSDWVDCAFEHQRFGIILR